ncbi:hypothetical protein EXIGLDRAFT_618459 [Exidia glandulosa HHB12029]|uniref:Uncharacterized protein n=1 Tax=Exidia glandulosa HHB12029 TaxID=1314781 RepID=A0A165FMW1_EXIGL|nr:hypothetical protein EXIGLDRAFT_618459 [Exidia glandulosa HHB12029]
MFIYNGKLDWDALVQNECITVVFPAGFALQDPVCAYWQWTKDSDGNDKTNSNQFGAIISVTKTADEYKVGISFGAYFCDGVFAPDMNSITVTMRNTSAGATSATRTLQGRFSDECRVPTTQIFTGKLNWLSYATNEMFTLVVPGGVANGAPVGLYYQWTVNGAGNYKVNHSITTNFRTITPTQRATTGKFDDGYYTFYVSVLSDGSSAKIHMSNSVGESTMFDAWPADFRQTHIKRGLIVRFGTGTDNGIFLARSMLTKYLGFDNADVAMLYFNSEPPNAPGVISDGQAAPTATRFKAEFTALIAGAKTGDVRFLYVDTEGTTYPDENGSGATGGNGEGWTMAEDDAGLRKEIVSVDWLAKAVKENLAPGVNLTILTSSCIRGGVLDAQTATLGVILAGCHETQFNVKALRTNDGKVDPWMYAIFAAIKSQAVTRQRGVPSYTVLFNEAKKFIQSQLAAGTLGSPYAGPSPDELKPDASNQDPQLSFYSGYLDPNEERFLFPFVAPHAGQAEGDSVRFPKDEYPTHVEL